jgi:SAM-dependent methyltransferase
MSMNQLHQEVKTYYDAHVAGKLNDFVEGNERVECAWTTIEHWAPTSPKRILEVGCGIGAICWRMTRRWQEAQVIGLDVSPKSLEIARKLFGSSRLSFVAGPLVKGKFAEKFDLIVLMDVYEHISVVERSALHEALYEVRNEGGRIILSFPTPRHLAWLRQHQPDQIQPVDEDINVDTIVALARDTGTEILLYQEVGVWHEGDYAHAVLGRREEWVEATHPHPPARGIKGRIRELLFGGAEPLVPPRSQRLALVRQRLGREYYPD